MNRGLVVSPFVYQVIIIMLPHRAYLEDLNYKERKLEVTFIRHGQLPCYFSLTLEAAVSTEEMKLGLKQGISLKMSPVLS